MSRPLPSGSSLARSTALWLNADTGSSRTASVAITHSVLITGVLRRPTSPANAVAGNRTLPQRLPRRVAVGRGVIESMSAKNAMSIAPLNLCMMPPPVSCRHSNGPRLGAPEAQYPEPMRDLIDIERHMERVMASGSLEGDWVQLLPRRLQRRVGRTWADRRLIWPVG